MYATEIIQCRFWRRDDGARASVFGAVPWTSDAERPRWQIVTDGYTLRWSDGTVGTYGHGRCPTFEDARQIAERANARRIDGLEQMKDRFPAKIADYENAIADTPAFLATDVVALEASR